MQQHVGAGWPVGSTYDMAVQLVQQGAWLVAQLLRHVGQQLGVTGNRKR